MLDSLPFGRRGIPGCRRLFSLQTRTLQQAVGLQPFHVVTDQGSDGFGDELAQVDGPPQAFPVLFQVLAHPFHGHAGKCHGFLVWSLYQRVHPAVEAGPRNPRPLMRTPLLPDEGPILSTEAKCFKITFFALYLQRLWQCIKGSCGAREDASMPPQVDGDAGAWHREGAGEFWLPLQPGDEATPGEGPTAKTESAPGLHVLSGGPGTTVRGTHRSPPRRGGRGAIVPHRGRTAASRRWCRRPVIPTPESSRHARVETPTGPLRPNEPSKRQNMISKTSTALIVLASTAMLLMTAMPTQAALSSGASAGASCTTDDGVTYATGGSASGSASGSSTDVNGEYKATADVNAGSAQAADADAGAWPSKNSAHAATGSVSGDGTPGTIVTAHGFGEASGPTGYSSTERTATAHCELDGGGGGSGDACVTVMTFRAADGDMKTSRISSEVCDPDSSAVTTAPGLEFAV